LDNVGITNEILVHKGLGIFGDHDHANPLPLVNTFKAALDNVGITNEILVYKGLGHAFANPSGTYYAPSH